MDTYFDFLLLVFILIAPVYQTLIRVRNHVHRDVRVYESSFSLLLVPVLSVLAEVFVAGYYLVPTVRQLTISEIVLLKYMGILVLLVAAIVYLLSQSTLGRSWTGKVAINQEHQLVTTGVYGYIRHPMYLSFILHTIGVALVSQNILLITGYVLWAIAVCSRVFKEEHMLEQEFGSVYTEYKKHTGLFFFKLIRN